MLKRLAIRGFKSFADPVGLDFGPGLNVIVGPNGSGKSNLAEAIIWALGEQRAGRLRAPGMHDMLYSGSADRPPAGFAEIAIQFGGDESGAQPELEVSRRLTRNGDAVYRVGTTACRLLDVQEALSARGLGPDSLAVIRQGQVEEIATSKPEARRAMLDEAAGVGIAKRRRRRAELKLARVADKLTRARDIAAEVASRAKALERQARAAERARTIDAQLAELREQERIARAVEAARAHELASEHYAVLKRHEADAERALADLRARRESLSDERTGATTARDEAEQSARAIRTSAERLAGRAELAAERVHELDARQRSLGQARADAAQRLSELTDAEAEIAHELAEAARSLEAAQSLLDSAESEDQEARTAEAEANDRVRRVRDERDGHLRALTDAQHRVEAAEQAVARADRELAERVGSGAFDRERDDRRLDIADRRLARDTERLDDAQATLDEVAEELREVERRRREAAVQVRLLAPDARDEATALLGDGLEVEPGFERAVGAALGALAEAVIAGDLTQATQALDSGVVHVVVPAPPGTPLPVPAGARELTSLITSCPAQTREHVHRVLGGAYLVDDLADVPAGHAGIFVTVDGTAYSPQRGVVTAARGEWAKRALHRRAQEEASQLAAVSEGIRDRLAACTAARDGARTRLAATERNVGQIRAAAAARRSSADADAQRCRELETERADALQQRDTGRAGIEQSQAAVAAANAALEGATHELARARERSTGISSELDDVRAAVRDARAAGSAVHARADQIAADAAAVRALLSGDENALAVGRALIDRAARAMGAAAQALEPVCNGAEEGVAEMRVALAEIDTNLAEAHRAVDLADGAVREAREARHAADVELRLAQERMEEAGPVPDTVPEEPLDPDALTAEREELERRRISIGAVNELAAQEREELTEREELLEEQIDDLERSCRSLEEHLGELDAAVDEGFEQIFTAVSERFAEVVGWLFPGGTGRLRLVDSEDEDTEQGVEVEVVPGGKRARPMSLMSGGERSLIAMAFMLSLAMARPAPFYLLDEVEAALDDANLRRFLGVLRRLAGETQFIVITHQQPTVEVADTLFGVTMGAHGVSQVLSRRLSQTVEGPARPYVRRQLRLVGS